MRAVRIVLFSVFALLGACGSSDGGSEGPGNDPPDEQNEPTDQIPGETTSKVRYTRDRTQSPITAAIANNLRAIAGASSNRNDDMFMKVGDSITDSFAVMSCFADGTVDLAGRNDLQDTIDFYNTANVSGASPCSEEWCQGATTSYNRASYAAEGGTTAEYPLSLTPRPFDQEDNAIKPRVALVEYGTNDSTLITAAGDVDGFVTFHGRMQALVDTMVQRGIVPVLYTIPPYIAPRPGYLNVPTMNAIIRVIAQSRAIPLIDFERESLPLPDYGLWDGTHPRVEFGGCVFTQAGLQYGYNVRNLITLQALDRVRHVLDGGGALDAGGTVSGTGNAASPFVVDALPFVDADETGPKTYRMNVAASGRVRFLALTRSGVAAIAVKNGDTQVASGNTIVHATLAAGTYDVTVTGGPYGIAVVQCDGSDPTCQ